MRQLLEPVVSKLQSEVFSPDGQLADFLCRLDDEDVLELYTREPEYGVF